MESDDKTHFEEPPSFGLKLLLNHEFPLQSKQIITPSAKQVFELMPLTMRYLKYYMGKKMQHKRPIMDYVNLVSAQRMYGCPIGGIGAGTIGRGFKGEFCRFQLHPGIYEYVVNPYCQFIVNIRDAKNETIFQSVLSTYQKPKKAPQSWEWNLNGADCEYTALYPRAWTTYDLSKYGIKLVCRQISPIIPHNYKDSSLPCAVFVWSVKNVSTEQRSVSITFTWSEVLPNKKKNHSKVDIERYSDEKTCGVSIEQKISDIPCTFTISKNKPENETIHEGYCSFNVSKNSSYVWECLKKTGKLEPFSNNMHGVVTSGADGDGDDKNKKKHNKSYRCDAVGLSSVVNLDPGGVAQTEFCLTWDMPVVQYKKDGHPYKRFYTKYFGSDGIAGASLSSYALKNYKKWEKQLIEWQDTILKNNNIPDWLKSALMNELYYVADGGTIWFDASDQYPESDPRHEFGLFGYLEGHEYRMYNTYDVHFYASFALAQLWPNLQVVLQYMFNDTITMESKKHRKSLYDGKKVKYKIKNSIPHDLGDPYDEPFTKINAYNIHDVSEWRDLNMKFILQVMRDYRLLKGHSAPFDNERYLELQYIDDIRDGLEDELYTRCVNLETNTAETKEFNGLKREVVVKNGGVRTGNILEMLYRNEEVSDEMSEEESGGDFSVEKVFSARQYLVDMYPSCAALVRRMCAWDKDGDGLPENTGTPDQTYDAWVMTGPSAYCGGLWLASLCVVKTIARLLNRLDDEKEFNDLLTKAKQSYEDKLWNGSYYKFDVKPSNARVVMSDQLAGHWYLRAAGLNESVFPEDHVKKALRVIYENNVLKFRDGKMGAVNGFVSEGLGGHVDRTAIQSEEMWTGVTYGLASLMIYEGMYDEAFKTAGGMYTTLTQMGLSFETPEALYENGNHRSIGYMRPLAVWSMLQAIVSRPPTRTQTNNVS